MTQIPSTGGNTPSYATIAEKGGLKRAKYDPYTKSFGPSGVGETRKLERLEQLEGKTARITVPTDLSSPAYLTAQSATKTQPKGDQLKSNTKGVDSYLSGSGSFEQFVSSVSEAQNQL